MNWEESKKSPKISRCRTARLLRSTVHLGLGSLTADKVVIRSNAASFRGVMDSSRNSHHIFTIHLLIYVFQRQLNAAHDSGKKAAIFPIPQTKENWNVSDQATSGDGAYARRGDGRHPGPCLLRHL